MLNSYPNQDHGYPIDEPCAVCSTTVNCAIDPRFSHSVCFEHKHISAVEISRIIVDKDKK